MKTKPHLHFLMSTLAVCLAFASCTKEHSGDDNSTDPNAATIAVPASQTAEISGSDDDSVYVLHECNGDDKRKAITEVSLPASIGTYLSANYDGYIFSKAFIVSETADDNSLKGFIVIIYYNDKPVALRFNADGSFKKVLEQREKSDLRSKGWHLGGRFQSRSGMMQDTVALTSLPVHVLTFFNAAYSKDTIMRAYKVHGNGYLLLSVNNGVYATAFNGAGAFFKRVKLYAHEGKAALVEAAALPATITSYLVATYPGYAFNRAFSISANGVLKGYVVVIDANGTRYSVNFDAQGNFEGFKALR